MALIYLGSGDQSSAKHSSRFFGPAVRWLFPSWPELKVDRAIFALRKVAHVSEYALLALLLGRALHSGTPANRPGLELRWAGLAFAIAVAYAVTDEIHQAFVPTRQGCVSDVFIDGVGALLGLIFLWFFRRCRHTWQHRAR